MAFEIIDGSLGGNTGHVTALENADWNTGLVGFDDYVYKVGSQFRHELSSSIGSGTITIHDGMLTMQGFRGGITANQTEELEFQGGSIGQTRNDLVVARYTKNTEADPQTDHMELAILQGKPNSGDPSLTTGIIREGATINEMPLKRIRFSGINIAGVDNLYTPYSMFDLVVPEMGVTTDRISTNAITNDKMANNSVQSRNISKSSIQTGFFKLPTIYAGVQLHNRVVNFPTRMSSSPRVFLQPHGNNTSIFSNLFTVKTSTPTSFTYQMLNVQEYSIPHLWMQWLAISSLG